MSVTDPRLYRWKGVGKFLNSDNVAICIGLAAIRNLGKGSVPLFGKKGRVANEGIRQGIGKCL